MDINHLVSEIKNYYKEFEYDKLIVDYIFTLQGSYNFIVQYEKDNRYVESLVSNKPIRSVVREMAERYEELKDSEQKFNHVRIEINIDGTFSDKYWWDIGKEHQDLFDYANVFFQWANERMMSMIFDFEKDNNLLPTQYDNDDELEYLSSWDSGVFTFHINDKSELEYKIVLTKDGVERVLEMPLKDYFIKGILKHYHSTNTELSNIWKPWNTMVLKSPHNDIPSDKKDEFVSYILE
ncbi:hypothetical protein CQ046_07705 [Chryseobacterium sp. MYb7]|uniref:hypothetical protein n=1 Tax=Chryseobacterium sp. MYb7 TaxID=1827290 RepID=UPI000CFF4145|nr:hypothetical protein [Chryseobacterium sp. MYb7]PRB04102.1 hypothetical protein CQ046_07705 [Chryseobacterium sp. MYb7]